MKKKFFTFHINLWVFVAFVFLFSPFSLAQQSSNNWSEGGGTSQGSVLQNGGMVEDVPIVKASQSKISSTQSDPAPTTTISEINVYAKPELTMQPTSSDIDSVYGIPMNVMDTPRTVTPVNKTLMYASGVNALGGMMNPMALLTVNPTTFGSVMDFMTDAPYVLGTQAVPYVNGIELSLTNIMMGNAGLPWNWNMIESFDILEGPANAVYGQTQGSNGIVNYVTKQPYFDKFRGYVYDTTGMYENYFWGLDVGGPINDKLAYRFSYMGTESGSWWQYVHNDEQDFYVALSAKPIENYTADWYFNMEFADASPLGYSGMNRPSNELFWNGLYYKGFLPVSQINSFPPTFPNGQPIPFNQFPGVGLEPINRRAMLIPPDAAQTGYQGMTQLIQKAHIAEGFDIVNNTLVWYTRHRAIQPAYFYDEAVMGDYEVDNRTEIRLQFDTPVGGKPGRKTHWGKKEGTDQQEGLDFSHYVDTGFEWHYQRNVDYVSTNFLNIPNQFDIMNENPLLWDARLTPAWPALVAQQIEVPIPGMPGYYFEPGNGITGTTDSQYWAFAPFLQWNIQFHPKVSLLAGARATTYIVDAVTPPGTPPDQFAQFRTTSLAPLFNISPVYKPFPWMTMYFNFNWLYSTAAADMGGFAPVFTENNMRLLEQYIEGGLKFNLFHNKLYLTAAGIRSHLEEGYVALPPVVTHLTAFQFNLNYQPDRHFWARAGFAYMRGISNFSDLPFGPPETQSYSTGYAFRHHLPLDDAGMFGFGYGPGIWPWIDFPDIVANAMVSYKFDNGFGVTLSGTWMAATPSFWNYTAWIPAQDYANIQVFYSSKRWEVSLYFWNFFNSHYWIPYAAAAGASPDSGSNSDWVVPGQVFWIQGTVAYKF